MDLRNSLPYIGIAAMLLLVEAIALLLIPPMNKAGYAAFEDPGSVANPLIFIAIMLIFTGALLILIKRGGKKIIAAIIAFSIFLTFAYIFAAVLTEFMGISSATMGLALLISLAATLLLYKYPEWYVIDILGILICAGAAAIFGISLEILPVILLLALLALYDAISVYKTKHMITLAEGVIDMKTPILVVVPKSLRYSYIREGLEIQKDKEERGAVMMGMGDLIMPSILVVSSQAFLKAPAIPGGITIPTIGAIAGSLVGLGILLYYVNSGKPQAGLPPLNGGTIAGFLIACALTGAWGWIPSI